MFNGNVTISNKENEFLGLFGMYEQEVALYELRPMEIRYTSDCPYEKMYTS